MECNFFYMLLKNFYLFFGFIPVAGCFCDLDEGGLLIAVVSPVAKQGPPGLTGFSSCESKAVALGPGTD